MVKVEALTMVFGSIYLTCVRAEMVSRSDVEKVPEKPLNDPILNVVSVAETISAGRPARNSWKLASDMGFRIIRKLFAMASPTASSIGASGAPRTTAAAVKTGMRNLEKSMIRD